MNRDDKDGPRAAEKSSSGSRIPATTDLPAFTQLPVSLTHVMPKHISYQIVPSTHVWANWSEFRGYLRVFLAELLGTFLLVLIGDAAVAQVVLGGLLQKTIFGGFLSISLGYGLALMVGILVAGGASGAHLNPAVTAGLAAVGRLRRPLLIPVYWTAQYLGAFLAALLVWAIYSDAILLAEPTGAYTAATRGIFASYPVEGKYSTGVLAGDQILGTSLLLLIICAVTDPRNLRISPSHVPLYLGLGLAAIHLGFGLIAGSAINPARDKFYRISSQCIVDFF